MKQLFSRPEARTRSISIRIIKILIPQWIIRMRGFLPSKANSRHMMVAVVLGTALAGSPAKAASTETTTQAVTDISKYCQTCWRNARLPADRWQDCTQEVLIRLLERVETDRWGSVLVDNETIERREFLRAIDAVKKRTQRARKFVNLTAEQSDSRMSINSTKDEREAVAKAAAEL